MTSAVDDSRAVAARNLAYALNEKLAFSSFVDPVVPASVNSGADDGTDDDGTSISFQASRRTTHTSTLSSVEGGSTRRSTGQSITLQPSKGPEITFQIPESKDMWSSCPDLLRARDSLCGLLVTRVREFQLITGCPLQGKRRTPAQLARLLDQAEEEGSEGAAWQALGMHTSPFLDIPVLPELVRSDLWGSLDMLLALAGHISPELASAGAAQSMAQVQANQQSTNTTTHNLFMLQAPLRPPPAADNNITMPNIAVASANENAATRQAANITTNSNRPNSNPFAYPSLLTNQGGATGAGYGASGSPLPRSLSSLTWLPALRQVHPIELEYLRSFLIDLRPQQRHVGVDDRLHSWFRDVKVQAARALVTNGSIPLCRGFAKYGVPHGCRSGIWEVAMGLIPGSVQQAEGVEFESLIHEACCQPLLADIWAQSESLLVRDSEQYFLFEEILRAVQLAFLRDTRVASRCSTRPYPRIVLQNSQQQQQSGQQAPSINSNDTSSLGVDGPGQVGAFPPSSVLLPHGSIMLAGPLCFMYDEPAAVYRMHRALYCRYWCKLHSLSPVGAPSPALPVLVRTFEELMQELDPEVVSHIHHLGVPCASIALPWISRAFVGFLPVEEVLLLWDRIIGLDSLLPVTLLAAAVLCFRRQVLLSCSAAREVLEAMADLSQLQTVPLLQAVLFQA